MVDARCRPVHRRRGRALAQKSRGKVFGGESDSFLAVPEDYPKCMRAVFSSIRYSTKGLPLPRWVRRWMTSGINEIKSSQNLVLESQAGAPANDVVYCDPREEWSK